MAVIDIYVACKAIIKLSIRNCSLHCPNADSLFNCFYRIWIITRITIIALLTRRNNKLHIRVKYANISAVSYGFKLYVIRVN